MMRGQPDSSHPISFHAPWALERSNLVWGWPRTEPAFGVVLFADIVGFTALSETIEPVEVFALLSGFHQEMARLIAGHGATIDDYVGDGAVAMWIASHPEASMLQNAVSCGFAMRQAMASWNRDRAAAQPLVQAVDHRVTPTQSSSAGKRRLGPVGLDALAYHNALGRPRPLTFRNCYRSILMQQTLRGNPESPRRDPNV